MRFPIFAQDGEAITPQIINSLVNKPAEISNKKVMDSKRKKELYL